MDCDVRRHIFVAFGDLVFDPVRNLLEKVLPLITSIGKDHEPVVVLASQNSANALGCLSHSIKSQEVLTPDGILLFKELHASPQVSGQRVLERHTKNYHSSTVVIIEIHAFRHFSPSD